jgi:hypothetical protein
VNKPIVSVLGTRWFDSPGFFLAGSRDTVVHVDVASHGWAVPEPAAFFYRHALMLALFQ